MARGISLIVAAIFALCVVSIQGTSISSAQDNDERTATPLFTVTPAAGMVEGQPDEVAPSHVYPPSVLTLTLADAGRSFAVPLNSLIVLHIPHTPYSYLNYNPSILQPYPGWPVPLPEPYPYMPNDSSQPQITAVPPELGHDIYPYPQWQLIAVGTGTTHLSLEYSTCYDHVCPRSPIYHFSVTITVRGYFPPYPTPIPPYPYPTEWPPHIGSADIYIGTAYLDQVVNVRVGQTVRIDLPFIAAHEALQIVYNRNIVQPLPGQQLDRPQRGGWLLRVVGEGSTTVTVNRMGCAYSSDGTGQCDSSLLFRVTLKSS